MIDKLTSPGTVRARNSQRKVSKSKKANEPAKQHQPIDSTIIESLSGDKYENNDALRSKLITHTLTQMLGNKASMSTDFKTLAEKIDEALKHHPQIEAELDKLKQQLKK